MWLRLTTTLALRGNAVLGYARELGLEKHTLVIFTRDNGAPARAGARSASKARPANPSNATAAVPPADRTCDGLAPLRAGTAESPRALP